MIPDTTKRKFQFTPCLIPVLGLIVGIVLAEFMPPLIGLTLTIAAISIAGFYYWRNHHALSILMMTILAVATGAIHFYKTNHELPANHIRHYLQNSPIESLPHVGLSGTIVTPATINQPKRTFPYHSSPNFRTRFLLQADRLQAVGKTACVTGLVEVSIPEIHDNYQPGMKVHLVGKLSSIKTRQPKLPCLKTFTYYKHNLIFARMSVTDADSVVNESIAAYSSSAILNRIQEWARGLLLGNEPPTGPYTDDLLSAVILGKQNFVENEFNLAMTRIGANHFLAVSGFNLAILAMGIWFIGQLLGLKRNTIVYLIICSVIFYGVITDFRPSVTRAIIMIQAVCIGSLGNRRSDTLNALALSAGIILIINPNQLFQPGFQLSFAATLGLVQLSQPINQFLSSFSFLNRNSSEPQITTNWAIAAGLENHIRQLLAASLAASLAAAPLVMYHFNLLSFIGPISSVLLYLPAIILTLTGFAQLVVAIIIPSLNPLLSLVTDYTAIILSKLAILLGKIPGSALPVASPPWFLVIAFLAVLFLPQIKHKFIGVLLIIAMYLSSWLIDTRVSAPWLYVSDQGQNVVINTGKGLALINAGAGQMGQAAKLTSQISSSYLAEPVFVMLTSPDQRYFNDLWQLIGAYPNTAVMIPKSFKRFSSRYEPVTRLMDDPNLHRQAVSEGTAIEINDLSFKTIFMPQFDQSMDKPTRMAPGSVILLEYHGSRVLVASVLTPMICRLISLNYPELRADTLIVSGSATISESMEDLIVKADIKKIAIGGWLNDTERRQWEQMAERTGCCVVEISEEGGFLVDRLGI